MASSNCGQGRLPSLFAGGESRSGRFGHASGETHGAGAVGVHEIVVGVGFGAEGAGGVGEGGVEDDDFFVAEADGPCGGGEKGVGNEGGMEEFDVEAGGHGGAVEAVEDGPAGGFVEDGGDDASVEDAVPALEGRVGFPPADDAVAVLEEAEAEAMGMVLGTAEAVMGACALKGIGQGAPSGRDRGKRGGGVVFGHGRTGHKKAPRSGERTGASGRIRTVDRRITNAVLYQLSYAGSEIESHYALGAACRQEGS